MLKAKARAAFGCIGVLSVMSGLLAGTFVARQAAAETSANTTFQVNVQESLSVTVTTPQTWASGDINTFLRNLVGLEVTSNNSSGFTASMYSSGGTSLTNVAKASATLPTLATEDGYACAADTKCSAFPANYWGYSLTDDADYNGTYYQMKDSTDPIEIMTGDGTTAAERHKSQDIYFGAKANAAKESGTYAGTVVISVVTGEITTADDDPNDNPVIPTNPVSPASDTANDGAATYDETNNRTVYTTTSSDDTAGTNSTTTTVSTGDTTSSYSAPAGVTTSSRASTNNALAVALATTAGVAAVSSGAFFFILAKRKKDDDDEEEEQA